MNNKMVRKRAQAQKALSPPKEIESRKSERRASINSDETPNKKQKRGEDESSTGNGDIPENNQSEIIIENKGNQLEYLTNEYNELPDHETLEKELSDKAKGYWESVKQDYHDFSNWTCLLQYVTDTEDNIEAARDAYNCFLRYYPYCYGYWKKFADIEKKNGNIEEATEVFDRGVQAIPVSIDLWVHYLNYSIQQNKGKKDQSGIRKLFKRAVSVAGMEFKSGKLWDAYIEWEKSLGNLKNVTEIYDQLIATPTQQYIKNWQRLKTHLENYSPGDVLPAKEYGKLMKEMDAFPPGMAIDEEKAPGEEDIDNDEETKKGSVDEEDSNLKETYVEVRKRVLKERESLFRETAQGIVKRWKFEESIKRPYFHVKPLEKSQIKNWKEYLDYEVKQGIHKKIVFLFERCMVVCALYENFWEKYLDYIETKDPEKARDVFSRACNTHLMKKQKLHIRWATFEERQKNYTASALILSRIDRNFPGMIMITQRRVGVARRMHNYDEMITIYENAIESAERIEDKIYFNIKYSHALAKFCNKKTEARDVLWSAIKLGKKHKRIYLQLLDLETHYGTVEMQFVNKLFSSVQNDMSVDADFRNNFKQRKVEFYEEYGDDIDEIIEVQDTYRMEQKKQELPRRERKESLSSKTSIRKSLERPPAPTEDTQRNQAPVNESMAYSSSQNSWFPPPNHSDQSNYNWQNYGQYGHYGHQQ